MTVSEPDVYARITDPARAAYVRRADRICASLDPERERKLDEVGTSDDPDGAYEETIGLAREQLRRIAALREPPGDGELIARNVIDRLQERLALREQLARDLSTSDSAAAARDQAQFEALGIAVHGFARGYGFRECGR